jgi:hypothetical protein
MINYFIKNICIKIKKRGMGLEPMDNRVAADRLSRLATRAKNTDLEGFEPSVYGLEGRRIIQTMLQIQ